MQHAGTSQVLHVGGARSPQEMLGWRLRLFRELLADKERVLGADHPSTLTTRNEITRLVEGQPS